MIYLEFLILSIWCALGAASFWYEFMGKKGDYTSARMLVLYALIWLGFAYLVFEKSRSPTNFLYEYYRPFFYIFVVLCYWPIEFLIKRIWQRFKNN